MASELYVETLKGLTSGANANKVIIPSGQTLDASAGTVVPSAGQVVAVKHAVETSAQTYSVASAATQNVSTLSITHTATGSNKIILVANIQGYSNSSNMGVVFLSDGSVIGDRGDAASNRIRAAAGVDQRGELNGGQYSSRMTITTEITPTSGSHTYTVGLINGRASTDTLYLNRSSGDQDNTSHIRSASTLMLMEIAG